MFANTTGGVLNIAFPDVCFVPTPAGPIPTPFPNLALSFTHIPSQVVVIICCGFAENLLTQGTISNGDQAGVGLGVVSGMVMGPDRYFLGSFKVMFGCAPAVRLTSLTGQNGMSPNMVGMTSTMVQCCVMVMV